MITDPPASRSPPAKLPHLRPELQVEFVASPDGRLPAAVVTDPIRNRYFRLAWPESIVFVHWQNADTFDGLHTELSARYGFSDYQADIAAVVKFATDNQLTTAQAS